MKKIILLSENKNLEESIKKHFTNQDIKITVLNNLKNIDTTDTDLIALDDKTESIIEHQQIINLHPSLLPAFDCEDSLYKSFISGIKVGGITIHRVEKGKFYGEILAQYPVLIGLETHFDQYKNEISQLSQSLYPKVIEAVLFDKVFDFVDLFNHSCQKGCNKLHKNCSSCRNCNN